MKSTYTVSASTAGYAIRDVTGNCSSGITANRFRIQMKKNSETSNGTYLSPRLPMMLRAISSRTNV